MNIGRVLDDFIEERLLNLHTAFVGKILSVHGGKAKVQPLAKVKQYGQEAVMPAVLDDVPIPKSLYKMEIIEWEQIPPGDHPPHKHDGHVKLIPVEAGDIALCVCVDRDISDVVNGNSSVPVVGHHEIKDAIIVHILSDW